MELYGVVMQLWVLVLAQVKDGVVALSPTLKLLEPWEHVPLWATLLHLKLPHRDFGRNSPICDGGRKVREGRVVVVGWAGVG